MSAARAGLSVQLPAVAIMTMKVVDGPLSIKGRGAIVVIDALPADLECGRYVRRVGSGFRWRVVGIETHAMPRSHTNGKPAGLLLQGQTSLPEVGSDLELEP